MEPATQSWNAARYARTARFVADFGEALLDMLAPRSGERILDLGCGDGALTQRIAARGADVVGVDSAPDMVAAAKARGLDARVIDGEALDFTCAFDAVFSNAAMHWMRQPDKVIAGIRQALKPGGRFVAEFGGEGNIDALVRALVAALGRRGLDGRACDPWYFPGPGEYRARLEAHGFTVDSIALFPRPTPLPGSLGDWLDTFAGAFLNAAPEAERQAIKDEVADAVRADHCDADGHWTVAYVRLRLAAHL